MGVRRHPGHPRRVNRPWLLALFGALVIACGVLGNVPFGWSAYADVRPVGSIGTGSEGPLPPSYERAGLFEAAPIDAAEIMLDAASFRTSDRDLRPTKLSGRLGRYTLPVDPSLVTAADLVARHHDYPAVDLGLPTGSGVYAAHAGTVRTVTERGRCGRGVVITGVDGYLYTYCHGSEVLAQVGDRVDVGEPIMLSGDTGHSTGPHLHFAIESPTGTRICPQDLLTSWFEGGEASPDTAQSSGCFYRSPDKPTRRHPERQTRQEAATPRSEDDGDGDGTGPRPVPRPKPSLPVPTPIPEPTPTPLPEETIGEIAEG